MNKKNIFSYLQIVIKSILAGFCITIGATAYLFLAVQGQSILGAFVFGIGLYAILQFGLWLYTGKVGYLNENNWKYLIKLLVCFIGNIFGVVVLSLLIKSSGILPAAVLDKTLLMVTTKNNYSFYEILIRSIMCGIIIYLAVEGYKKSDNALAKALFNFTCVAIFIICGFDHVIANACYYTYAGVLDWKTISWFLIMAVGNGLGSVTLNLLFSVNKS